MTSLLAHVFAQSTQGRFSSKKLSQQNIYYWTYSDLSKTDKNYQTLILKVNLHTYMYGGYVRDLPPVYLHLIFELSSVT